MLVSRKESILDCVFRVSCVPQELKSSLVKHGKVARHDIVEFLRMLAKETWANSWLTFNDCPHSRHKLSPFQVTRCGRQACNGTSFWVLRLPQTKPVQSIDQSAEPRKRRKSLTLMTLIVRKRSGPRMVSKLSRRSRHLSAIRERAVHLEMAIQGTRTNPGEARYSCETKCRNARHLSTRVSRPRQSMCCRRLLQLRNLVRSGS